MADTRPASAAAPPPPPTASRSTTATVARADVPIYLEGLGTVQAFYTVTVTARVDGELQKVAFTEGQTVKKGDLLAQIDPRPYQAALDQALATKAKDEAQLENAKRDLERYMHAGSRRIWRASRPSTRSARWSTQLAGAAQGRSGRHRQCAHAARLHDASPRRSTAAPASAWSTRATSCTRPTPPASWW